MDQLDAAHTTTTHNNLDQLTFRYSKHTYNDSVPVAKEDVVGIHRVNNVVRAGGANVVLSASTLLAGDNN